MNIKNLSAFILLFLFLFASCQNNISNTDNKNSETKETVAKESTEFNYYKNIPGGLNYGGYAFTVLTWDPEKEGWNPYIIIEEMTGDVLNDAAYDRNMEVMQLLNVEIGYIYKEPAAYAIADKIITDNAAGDCTYDIAIFWGGMSNAPSLILQNQIYDWKQVPYVNLNADWYNHSANDAYTVNGKQYFCVSALTYTLQGAYHLLFNKDMCVDYGFDFPYQLAYDGKWTFEVFSRYIKGMYSDLNGDGIVNSGDLFGLNSHINGISAALINWGEPPLKTDATGFVLNIFNDRISAMTDKLYEFAQSQDVIILGSNIFEVFNAGRSLFEIFSSDSVMLRDVEFDFGYIPFPKYDELQQEYICEYSGGLTAIPIIKTGEEVSRTGAIFEALAAGSAKYVADAFITKYIESKVLRDGDSVEMYRMTRYAAFYSSGRAFDSTNLINGEMQYYVQILQSKNGSANLASQYAKNVEKLQTTLDGIYQMILENQ